MIDETKFGQENNEEIPAEETFSENSETEAVAPTDVGEDDVQQEAATEKPAEEPALEAPKEIYAFRWDYSEQYINDRSREASKKTKREKGIIVYAVVMTVAFLLAFSILLLSLNLDNIAEWFRPSEKESYSVSDIVDIGMPSSLSILATKGDGTASAGSGFIFTETGYVMTNYHVVENAVDIVVIDYKYNTYSASLIGYDSDMDMAVLYIENGDFAPVTIGDSSTVKLGEEVVTIGCPSGDEFMFSVSNGIISGVDRTTSTGAKMLQTNAPLNPGNSGGPLFDSKGHVIGIVTSKLVSTEGAGGTEIALEGMAFAIPINTAMEKASEIIATDLEKPMLGVTAVSVEAGRSYYFDGEKGRIYLHQNSANTDYYIDEYMDQVEITQEMLKDGKNYIFDADVTGIAITGVTKGLGADGVLQIRDIVTEVDGVAVASVVDVKAVFEKFKPGDSVEIKFYRDGKFTQAKMTLKTKGDMLAANSQ